MVQIRHLAIGHEAALRAKWDAASANLPANSPLWVWTPFLARPDETKVDAMHDRSRQLDRRQSDTEIMLDRGDFRCLSRIFRSQPDARPL
jgi:hypothetical protein